MTTTETPPLALSQAPETKKYLHPRDCTFFADAKYAQRNQNIQRLMKQRAAIDSQIREGLNDPAVKTALQSRAGGTPARMPDGRAVVPEYKKLLTDPPTTKSGDVVGIDFAGLERQRDVLDAAIKEENLLNSQEQPLCRSICQRLSREVQPYFLNHHFRDMAAMNAGLIQRMEDAIRDEQSFHAGMLEMPAGNVSAMKAALQPMKLMQEQLVNFCLAMGDDSFSRLPPGYANWQDRPLGAHIPAPV